MGLNVCTKSKKQKSSSNDIKKEKSSIRLFLQHAFNWCIFISTSYEEIFVDFFLKKQNHQREIDDRTLSFDTHFH